MRDVFWRYRAGNGLIKLQSVAMLPLIHFEGSSSPELIWNYRQDRVSSFAKNLFGRFTLLSIHVVHLSEVVKSLPDVNRSVPLCYRAAPALL